MKDEKVKSCEDAKEQPFTREDFHNLIKKAVTVPAPKPVPKDK
jgi:hypothetical protein